MAARDSVRHLLLETNLDCFSIGLALSFASLTKPICFSQVAGRSGSEKYGSSRLPTIGRNLGLRQRHLSVRLLTAHVCFSLIGPRRPETDKRGSLRATGRSLKPERRLLLGEVQPRQFDAELPVFQRSRCCRLFLRSHLLRRRRCRCRAGPDALKPVGKSTSRTGAMSDRCACTSGFRRLSLAADLCRIEKCSFLSRLGRCACPTPAACLSPPFWPVRWSRGARCEAAARRRRLIGGSSRRGFWERSADIPSRLWNTSWAFPRA